METVVKKLLFSGTHMSCNKTLGLQIKMHILREMVPFSYESGDDSIHSKEE